MLIIPKEKAEFYNHNFDLYGDSYTEVLSMRQLDFILHQMELYQAYIDQRLMKKLGKEVFDKKVAYILGLSVEDRVELRSKGYKLVEDLNDRVSHIIISNKSELKQLGYINQFLGTRPRVKLQYIEMIRGKIE